MPTAGGPATLYGVLYQILGSIDWAGRLRLRITGDSPEAVSQALLVIEPSGGGGDIQIRQSHKRVVEQWKAKGDHGTWSFTEFVEKVLPDLYLAVDESNLQEDVEYRFVTEGRMGDWVAASEMFSRLSLDVPDDPPTPLEDERPERFARGLVCSEQVLFRSVVQSLRQAREVIGQEQETHTCRKLWHLLSRTKFIGSQTSGELQQAVNRFLLSVVGSRDQVDAKRRELCSLILERAGQGELTITPVELLREVGLDRTPLIALAEQHARMRAVLAESFSFFHYRSELDVRPVFSWPPDKRILILCGEAGTGKTWRLCAVAAQSVVRPGDFAALVSSTGKGADTDISNASSFVWQKVLGHDASLSLAELPRRTQELNEQVDGPTVTICVDGVRSADDARQLIESVWGQAPLRLAITTTTAIGQAVARELAGQVELQKLGELTDRELGRALDLRGIDWPSLPGEVRRTLGLPLLAGIYCDIAGARTWRPIHEYELYEHHWQSISVRGCGSELPLAPSRLANLAGSLLDVDGPAYPWRLPQLDAAGVDTEHLQHLLAVGWLTRTEDGDFAVWHERLLNWAVAEGLFDRVRSGALDERGLTDLLRSINEPAPLRLDARLGYVPMDFLWLASDAGGGFDDVVATAIVALEGTYPDRIFALLATLGARIVRAIERRVRDTSGLDFNPYPRLAAQAILTIRREEPEALSEMAMRWLMDDCPDLVELAERILVDMPSAEEAVLDRLWEIHSANALSVRRDKDDPERFTRYRLSFRSLRACIRLRPQWLKERILGTNQSGEPMQELAYLVAGLDRDDALDVWEHTKEKLFAIVPDSEARSLASCIRCHHDAQETDRLERWVTHTDVTAAAAALSALAEIEPRRAIDAMDKVGKELFLIFGAWWFPKLVLRNAKDTCDAVLSRMRDSDADAAMLANVFSLYPDQMTRGILKHLLEDLEESLNQCDPSRGGGALPALHMRMDLLSKLWDPPHLSYFRELQGSDLERKLVALAEATMRNGMGHSYPFAHSVSLLLKIGGNGITKAVNAALTSESPYARFDGLEWAAVRPDQATIEALEAILQEPSENGGIGALVRHKALERLIALDEIDKAIAAVLAHDRPVSTKAVQLLSMPGKVNEAAIGEAVKTLNDRSDARRCAAVTILGMSRRPDLAHYILDVMRAAKADDWINIHCMLALRQLRSWNKEAARLVAVQLSQGGTHRLRAVETLLDLAGEAGAKDVEVTLSNALNTGQPPADEELLILTFWRMSSSKAKAADLMWRYLQIAPLGLYSADSYEVLGDSAVQAARERLWDRAFPGGPPSDVTFAAIRGLARLDPEAAVRATTSALHAGEGTATGLAAQLLNLAGTEGMEALCRHLPREPRTSVRWDIGRALRKVEDVAALEQRITAMCASSDGEERRAGLEVAGWLDTDGAEALLKAAVTTEIDDRMRSQAYDAWIRLGKRRSAYELMQTMPDLDDSQKWLHLEGVTQLADPDLLTDSDDTMYLGLVLESEAVAFWHHVQERIRRRREEVANEAAKHDRRMNDEP